MILNEKDDPIEHSARQPHALSRSIAGLILLKGHSRHSPTRSESLRTGRRGCGSQVRAGSTFLRAPSERPFACQPGTTSYHQGCLTVRRCSWEILAA